MANHKLQNIYLGNVFHMVSRHVLGNQAGIKHIVLVGASIYEILGLIITSILIGFGGMIIFNLTNSFFFEPINVNHFSSCFIFHFY